MPLSEKLRELRKNKGLTQQDVAEKLFVSRTAVSKWESGRGYPNLDSLKQLAAFYGVSLDILLSEDGKEERVEKKKRRLDFFSDILFGLLDCSFALFFFLPFFGEKENGVIYMRSLLSLCVLKSYVKIVYILLTLLSIAYGILTLAMQNCKFPAWKKYKKAISAALSVLSTLFFIASMQPSAASFTFILLIIKAIAALKKARDGKCRGSEG